MSVDIETKFHLLSNEHGEPLRFEHAETLAYPGDRVWTVVEGDDPCAENHTCDEDGRGEDRCKCCQSECEHRDDLVWYVLPGYHIVNRLYYLITEEPWTAADSDIEWIW